MMSHKKEFLKILKNGYAVRSGVYSSVCPEITTYLDGNGEYQPILSGKETQEDYLKLLQVDMMSDYSKNEDELAESLFANSPSTKFDNVLGYYQGLFIGYVSSGEFRKNGSSGGLTTWILVQLLKHGYIDGVIHVHPINPNSNSGVLFKYVVSRTEDEIVKGSKSRYYPMELSGVLREVSASPGKYAVVGIPEFITELRLLAEQNPIIKKRITYMIGLVCGHQKTAKYTEALAWQHGIKPGDLDSIDYRLKQPERTAIDYLHRIKGKINKKNVELVKNHDELYVDNWAAGFFKSKFSDFTDNAFNEVADVVLGDAWLPEYNNDGRGNNIVITRNKKLQEIIENGIKSGELKLDVVDAKKIKDSQLGLIHHIRDELPYRLAKQKIQGRWVPTKRVRPSLKIPYLRKWVQDIRYGIAIKSHKVYREALRRDDWLYFERKMDKRLLSYKIAYSLISLKEKGILQEFRKYVAFRTRLKRLVYAIKKSLRVRRRISAIVIGIRNRLIDRKYKYYDGAILTLSGYFNYGNVIQRYALQKFLETKGFRFVSYFHDAKNTDDSSFGSSRDSIKDFVMRNIKTKKPSPTDKYRAYIVGSDQVWRNWDYEDEKKSLGYYFIDFVEKQSAKKIAYAASFGVETVDDAHISRAFIDYIKPTLESFSAISVREASAKKILKETWGVGSRRVVDPTMLLDASVYDNLINQNNNLERTSDTFAYILGLSAAKVDFVDKIEKESRGSVDRFYPKSMSVLPPVEQWLKGFRDAKLVVTDSFHGTVFSIINNTPFIVIENQDGGVTRLANLLSMFNLEDRLVAEVDAKNFNYSDLKPIEWGIVNKQLAKYKKDSEEWLIKSLED